MSMRNVSNNINNTPSPQIVKILWRQQQDLLNKHPDGVTIIINEEDPLDIQAEIKGPKDTPYEGGIFKVKIVVGSEFPEVAPKGFCITKIFHPNVSEKGEICVNTLKKDWNPKQWSLYHVLEVIKCLLIVPFPESSLNEEAGKLFMEDYDKFFKIANIFTNVHATPKETSDKRYNNTGNNIIYDNSSIFTGNNLNLNNFTNKESEIDIQSFKTPSANNIGNNNYQAYQSDSAFNYNLLRHSKSVSLKSTAGLKIGDHTGNIISLRKDSNLEIQNDIKSCHKPSIGSLPFLLRNTSNSISQNSENQNYLSFLNSASGLTNGNGVNISSGISMPSPTPRSKKEEIKKWLSRI